MQDINTLKIVECGGRVLKGRGAISGDGMSDDGSQVAIGEAAVAYKACEVKSHEGKLLIED